MNKWIEELLSLQSDLKDMPVNVPREMDHFLAVMLYGASKYDANNWLEEDGNSSDETSMHNSMFHHLAESYAGTREDTDSGLDPLLHLATRALMVYTRRQRNLIHPKDRGNDA